jgi:hypothetical protein
MSVLLYDPVEKKHVLLLKDGPWAGKRWYADLGVCHSPFCGCFAIHFECVAADAEWHTQPEPVRFSLDTQMRCIDRPLGGKIPAVSDSLAEALSRELGEEGWKYLYEFLLSEKQKQIENCNPKHADADFPPEVLKGESTVVGYGEIFPLSPALAFKVDMQHWAAVDDYCVNPDCDCHHVILQFVTDEHKHRRPGTVAKAPPAMRYDYKDGTFQAEQVPERHHPSLRTLLAGVQDQWPRFNTELKKRHQKLRVLFGRALQKREAGAGTSAKESDFVPALPPESKAQPTTKTGRNEPCPCGSGRKFKKCCGR